MKPTSQDGVRPCFFFFETKKCIKNDEWLYIKGGLNIKTSRTGTNVLINYILNGKESIIYPNLINTRKTSNVS